MISYRRSMLTYLLILLSGFILSACSEKANDQSVETPIAFDGGDECHLCGMAISGFPGPKGQAFEKQGFGGQQSLGRKFCSTRDLFSWYLQPENTGNTSSIFVHDMARSDWNTPNDEHLIDARTAWFVNGSSQMGAMGPTLAAFAQKAEAEKFAKTYGGEILSFSQVTMEKLNNPYGETMTPAPNHDAMPHHDHSAMDHSNMQMSEMTPPAMPGH